jgi:hypothetical protein
MVGNISSNLLLLFFSCFFDFFKEKKTEKQERKETTLDMRLGAKLRLSHKS